MPAAAPLPAVALIYRLARNHGQSRKGVGQQPPMARTYPVGCAGLMRMIGILNSDANGSFGIATIAPQYSRGELTRACMVKSASNAREAALAQHFLILLSSRLGQQHAGLLDRNPNFSTMYLDH